MRKLVAVRRAFRAAVDFLRTLPFKAAECGKGMRKRRVRTVAKALPSTETRSRYQASRWPPGRWYVCRLVGGSALFLGVLWLLVLLLSEHPIGRLLLRREKPRHCTADEHYH